ARRESSRRGPSPPTAPALPARWSAGSPSWGTPCGAGSACPSRRLWISVNCTEKGRSPRLGRPASCLGRAAQVRRRAGCGLSDDDLEVALVVAEAVVLDAEVEDAARRGDDRRLAADAERRAVRADAADQRARQGGGPPAGCGGAGSSRGP